MNPLQITVRSVSDTPVIRYHVNKHFQKLLAHTNKMHACKVVIDTEQRHRNRAQVFSVSVEIALPRKVLACKKMNLNLFIAIREVFSALDKSLQKYNKRKVITIDRYRSHTLTHSGGDDPHMPQIG